MTNEEKKAIDKLKNGKKYTLVEIIRVFKKEGIENFRITRKEYLDIILNLLEKQDNRINQLENMNEFQSKDIKKIVDYTFELNKEIEQQDKIIDLMSEQLTTPIHDKKWIKKYYENKVNGGNER